MRANRWWMRLLGAILLVGAAGGWVDPVDDCLDTPVQDPFDLIAVTTAYQANELLVTLLFEPNMARGIEEVSGFIDFDVDLNAGTGPPSQIEQFGFEPFPPMGVEYRVELYGFGIPGLLFYTEPGGAEILVSDEVPVVTDGSTVSVWLPRCDGDPETGICAGALYSVAVLIGTSLEGYPTDRAPNDTDPLVTTAAPADFDLDGDVDGDDLAHMVDCRTGPAIESLAPGCDDADLDGDQDVDQSDFGLFQRCHSGEGYSPDPDCAL